MKKLFSILCIFILLFSLSVVADRGSEGERSVFGWFLNLFSGSDSPADDAGSDDPGSDGAGTDGSGPGDESDGPAEVRDINFVPVEGAVLDEHAEVDDCTAIICTDGALEVFCREPTIARCEETTGYECRGVRCDAADPVPEELFCFDNFQDPRPGECCCEVYSYHTGARTVGLYAIFPIDRCDECVQTQYCASSFSVNCCRTEEGYDWGDCSLDEDVDPLYCVGEEPVSEEPSGSESDSPEDDDLEDGIRIRDTPPGEITEELIISRLVTGVGGYDVDNCSITATLEETEDVVHYNIDCEGLPEGCYYDYYARSGRGGTQTIVQLICNGEVVDTETSTDLDDSSHDDEGDEGLHAEMDADRVEEDLGDDSGEDSEEDASDDLPSCTDSDGGIDIVRKGTATDDTGSKTDVCTSATKLNEYFCEPEGNFDVYTVDCKDRMGELYSCSDGACAVVAPPVGAPDVDLSPAETPEPVCEDSDEGMKYTVKGTATFDTSRKTDTCLSAGMLREYYCSGNTIKSADIDCAGKVGSGYFCYLGVCKKDTISLDGKGDLPSKT